MFDSHTLSSFWRKRAVYSTPGLNTGFFISAHDELIRSQHRALPNALIQVQNAGSFLFELRIPREYPAMMLPRFNGIFTEPSPYGGATNLGHDASSDSCRCNFVTAKSRQWNALFKWQFTRQRFNLDNAIRGKNRTGVRLWAYLQDLRDVSRKIFFSTCLRFDEVNLIVLQWTCYSDRRQPSKRFLLEQQNNTAMYISWRFAQAQSVPLWIEERNKGLFWAYILQMVKRVYAPIYIVAYKIPRKIRHCNCETVY